MPNLQLLEHGGRLVADSREIAAMIGKRHDHLIRDIDGYVSILSQNPYLGADQFFIQSTYKAGTGKEYKLYFLTRKGCDMVANKMNGERGVLFTATYVTKFEDMERAQRAEFFVPRTYKEALLALVAQVEENERLETEKLMLQQQVAEFEPKASYVDQILQSVNSVTTTQIAKDYGLSGRRLNVLLHESGVQYKLHGQWLLYAKYQSEGYTKSKSVEYFDGAGNRHVKMNTQWTQKGRLFIHELLARQGIVPIVDREVSAERVTPNVLI